MATDCIETTHRRDASGYGRCQVRRFGRRVNRVHVLAWIDAHGMLPPVDKPCILHHCDNPPCINIEHLYAGTIADNNWDRVRRGRHHQQRKACCPKCGGEYSRYKGNGRRYRICLGCRRTRYATDPDYRDRRRQLVRESNRRARAKVAA